MTDTATRIAPSKTDTADEATATSIGLLVLRIGFGGLMAAYGTQKLFGWFNGMGWRTTADSFTAMGYNPGELFGTLAGVTELVGGLLLVFGLFTPLAGAIVLGTMINAINVMWAGGLFPTDPAVPGFTTPLLFALVAGALAFTGPGRFSLDAGRPWARHGVVWGAAAVGIAVAAAVLTLILKAVL
ncbi:DoxX family protein [Nocardia caishijiensis]|uniref:Oxidoreductase n=1 Tax=Nocardia caishijiensis TaxID=184756 RepID=A0ABQ6YFD6_9NOCA|nr:DoxX family protein [Nocardia caishijiensis]KAF0835811.1 putative oxidoreductase [Nocardia caishijiensis]